MAEKIQPDELRKQSVKELQQTINELHKQKTQVLVDVGGRVALKDGVPPGESIRTIKKNIARAKTILNEKQDRVANSRP